MKKRNPSQTEVCRILERELESLGYLLALGAHVLFMGAASVIAGPPPPHPPDHELIAKLNA